MIVGNFEIQEPVPELHNTHVIAILRPWINVGRVGTQILRTLRRHLGAEELGRLSRPGNFYDFTTYRPRTRIVDGQRTLNIPNTIVYYAHDDDQGRDFLLLEMREPQGRGEDYTEGITSMLKQFNVTEYCRIGGFYDAVPHTRPLLVTGSLTPSQIERAGHLITSRSSSYQGPTSIVNLVTDELAESDVTVTSLMVHLPQYLQLGSDHMGAARLMEVLCEMYGFPSYLADSARGERQYRDLEQIGETSNPEVKTLINDLERYYDRRVDRRQEEAQPEESFPSEMAQFLQEMGDRLENGQDEH